MLPDRYPLQGVKDYRTEVYAPAQTPGKVNPGSRREEVLLALDGFGEPLEQQGQILRTVHKVDFRGVDHQQVAGRVVEEEVLISLGHLLDIGVADGLFLG